VGTWGNKMLMNLKKTKGGKGGRDGRTKPWYSWVSQRPEKNQAGVGKAEEKKGRSEQEGTVAKRGGGKPWGGN